MVAEQRIAFAVIADRRQMLDFELLLLEIAGGDKFAGRGICVLRRTRGAEVAEQLA